jgi:hypothetical protein
MSRYWNSTRLVARCDQSHPAEADFFVDFHVHEKPTTYRRHSSGLLVTTKIGEEGAYEIMGPLFGA